MMLTLYNPLIAYMCYSQLIHLIHSPFHMYFDDYMQYIFSHLLKLDTSLALLTRTSSTGSTNESKSMGGLARRKGGRNPISMPYMSKSVLC